MLQVKIESDLEEFIREWSKELIKAEVRAMVSTFNEVVKYTLPNTPNTVPTSKHLKKDPTFNYNRAAASKVVPEMKENLKKLRSRIIHDIVGDGKVGSGIPRGIPVKSGKIKKGTLEGNVYAGYVVRKKPRAKKGVVDVLPENYTNSSTTLLKHILDTTYMRKAKNVAYRVKAKSGKILWIDSANTAKAAATELSLNAGVLLMGWRNLEKKIMSRREADSKTILDKVLAKTRTAPQGSGSIRLDEEKVIMKGTNPNVSKYDQGYQQRVVNENIVKNLSKHLEREISYINTSKIRKTIKNKYNK